MRQPFVQVAQVWSRSAVLLQLSAPPFHEWYFSCIARYTFVGKAGEKMNPATPPRHLPERPPSSASSPPPTPSTAPPLLSPEQAMEFDEAEARRRRQLRAFDPLSRLPAHRLAGPRPRAFTEGAGAASAEGTM